MKLPWLFLLLVLCLLLVLYAAGQRIVQLAERTTAPGSAAIATPPATHTPLPVPAATRPAATPAAGLTNTPFPSQTAVVTATSLPSPQAQIVTGYIAYRVKEGETLADVAQRAGSTVALIQQHNRFSGEIHAQQPLIIPQIDVAHATITSQSIIVVRGMPAAGVALTLDAGASAAPTAQMLDALKARNITITFFLSGDWIEKNPELTRRILADGHEIGNHSVNHPDFRLLTDEEIGAQLDGMSDILFRVAGVRPAPYLRPPFGSYDERVLRVVIAHGYLPIFWTLDSLDAFGEVKTADYLVDRLTNTLSAEKRGGAILLAHCGNPSTAEALPRLLDRFAAMGVTITTLSRVL